MEELNQKEILKEIQKADPVLIRDMVGEPTDLNKCPGCTVHPDCFANIRGYCTALRKTDGSSPCRFYKNIEVNTAEAKRCYQLLKDRGRSDLISRYIKPLSAMGMLDDEIEAAEQYGEVFDSFRETNYEEQLAKMLEDDGLDDDLLDYAENADAMDTDTEDEIGKFSVTGESNITDNGEVDMDV